MLSRVINVALRPKEEWPKIAEEKTTIASLMVGIVVPLAAIGPVCEFLNAMFYRSRWPIIPSASWMLTAEVINYLLALAGVLVAAFIVQKLAPNFQSSGDMIQAMKLVVYAQAPFWVAGVLTLIPFLGFLPYVVGLYGLYLAYVGLPFVMKTPQDKALGYMIVVALIMIVIYVIIAVIIGAVFALHMAGSWIR